MRTLSHILVLGLASLLFPVVHASADQDGKSIAGHLKVETQVDCLKIHVYLTNATDKEITIVTGAGRVSRTVVPVFFSGSTHLVAASWKEYPTRDMRPVPLTLRPSEETLYDTYIVPHPPGDKIEGTISFRVLDKPDHEFTVRLGSQKIQTPMKDGNAEPKK